MGTIKQGILGGFSGKVGTVIGGSWKGIDYMRSIPASVANPRTAAQVDQRTKFTTALNFLQPLTSFIRVGFKDYAVKMSAFNAAMAYTIRNAVTGVYPEYGISYADALVSRGSLTGALNPTVAAPTPEQIDFSWVNNSGEGNALATDKVLLVVYNSVKDQALTVIGGSTRSSGSQSVNVPAVFAGDALYCFIAFQNENQSEVSNSTYLGEVVAS
ncbi:DUF6266 family protein [Sunxiuqinia sp. sy24]|uniref:DUF6266 family protein n=1 Tax=Sunxiuqinia sp. sy24 TaxID=3461495 RepID=UPI00404531C4